MAFPTKKLFSSPHAFGEDEVAYHSISTNHKYMAELGLGVFTTGQLYNWMSQRNSKGEFVNLKLLYGADSSSVNSDDPEVIKNKVMQYGHLILNGAALGNVPNTGIKCELSPWRAKDRTGDYETFNYKDWTYNEYKFSDLLFSSFTDKSVALVPSGTYYTYVFNSAKNLDTIICNFIEMNNVARFLPMVQPPYSTTENAAANFILDVKTGLTKSIKWKTDVFFSLNVDPSNRCDKLEEVEFELHLYDSYLARNSDRTVAFNNFNVASNYIDAFGRTDKKDGTGENQNPNPNGNPADSIAAPLGMSYIAAKGEFRSGTQQNLCILTTDVPKADYPTLEEIQENPVESKQSNGILNPEKAIKPGRGYGIPLFAQNGNPLQWAPQYKTEKGCRDSSDNEKFAVPLQNLSDKLSFKRGDKVMINEIDGFWTISSFGEVAETEVLDTQPKGWNFTYLMMNYDGFFRSTSNNTFNAKVYEDAVYQYYYGTASNTGVLDRATAIQVTSWDFMGPNIGGLRQANALSSTVFNRKPDGDVWPDYENGAYSSPFFGCVFPDGYDAADKFANYNLSNHSDFIVRQLINSYTLEKFFNDIPGGLPIFANNNDNNSPDENNVGMFISPDVSSLINLPADIALNASPSGVYGSPVIDNSFTRFLDRNSLPAGTGYQNQVAKYFEKHTDKQEFRYAWLYTSGNINSSMFDLEPINSAKIQFRPLKAEIYAALDQAGPNGFGEFADTAKSFIVGGNVPVYAGVLDRQFNPLMKAPAPGSLRYNSSLIRVNDLPGTAQSARFPDPAWSLSWQNNPTKPGGAFGVIGATCTIQAANKFTFKTENVIGVRSWFGIGVRPWYPSLGGQGNNYDSLQNTQLYVRIFHKWPKEQTIFDPQTFSVFHFNPGINDLDVNNNYDVDITVYQKQNGDLITNERIVNGGAIIGSSVETLVVSKDIFRRGKLLPCPYIRPGNIGFSVDQTFILGAINANPATPRYYDIYIEKQGTGYLATDTFTVSGGIGVPPILNPVISSGLIVGFTFKDSNHGYGYEPESFMSIDDTPLTSKKGLAIVAVSVTGTGFVGKFIAGKAVSSPQLTDVKPESVGSDFIQLTPNIDTNSNSGGGTAIINEFVAPRSEDVNINNPSSDQSYDLFFHFHNDISHTLIGEYGAPAVAPLENHVTLTISTS